MIRYFRKIRQNLLSERKTGKPAFAAGRYLKYALGEIFLVMIGILLALQINNWNEDRKDERIEKKALHDLLQEFKSNKTIFDKHYASKQRDEAENRGFIKMVRNQLTIDTATNLRLPPLSRKTFDPAMGMVNSIMNSDKLDKLKNDSLRYWLSNWQFLLKDYAEEEESQYQLLLNTLIPYEATLFPFRLRNEPLSTWYNRNEIDEFRRKAFKDMQYQNLIIQNHNEIYTQMREGEKVSNAIDQIIRFLEIESNRKQ